MLDSFVQTAILISCAFLAGMINTVAGGGTLLTFPALLRFGALSTVMANGTSTMALVPGSIAGAWGYRRELVQARPWLLLLLGPSLIGGVLGAALVTRLPETWFAAMVPWLLLTASLLFLAQPWLVRRFLPHAKGNFPSPLACAGIVVFQFLVAVYGGYFGAGIGILMISSLGLMGLGDIHRINAIKTILASVINAVSVVVFVIDHKIDYRFGPAMAVGAILGGYMGAVFGRLLPKALIRWFVIVIGLGLAGYYFALQWGLLESAPSHPEQV
jgi:uncharacterized membrane protein YfcA